MFGFVDRNGTFPGSGKVAAPAAKDTDDGDGAPLLVGVGVGSGGPNRTNALAMPSGIAHVLRAPPDRQRSSAMRTRSGSVELKYALTYNTDMVASCRGGPPDHAGDPLDQ